MNYTAKQRDQYNHDRDITCERLGITVNQYNWFRRIGNDLHKWYEESCNGTVEDALYEQSTDTLYEKADKKAKELGLHIFYQTDPRGATIYLSHDKIEDNNYNRFGSECIY